MHHHFLYFVLVFYNLILKKKILLIIKYFDRKTGNLTANLTGFHSEIYPQDVMERKQFRFIFHKGVKKNDGKENSI